MNEQLHATINEAHFVHMVLAAVGYALGGENQPTLERRLDLLKQIAEGHETEIDEQLKDL